MNGHRSRLLYWSGDRREQSTTYLTVPTQEEPSFPGRLEFLFSTRHGKQHAAATRPYQLNPLMAQPAGGIG